jgi:hypothetical protein
MTPADLDAMGVRDAVRGAADAPCGVCGDATIKRIEIGDGFAAICSNACLRAWPNVRAVFDSLNAEKAAHELEKRAHERTWQHKAKMIDERDAARAEVVALRERVAAADELLQTVFRDWVPADIAFAHSEYAVYRSRYPQKVRM